MGVGVIDYKKPEQAPEEDKGFLAQVKKPLDILQGGAEATKNMSDAMERRRLAQEGKKT